MVAKVTKTYTDFSGVDFFIEVDGEILEGMVVQGVRYSYERHMVPLYRMDGEDSGINYKRTQNREGTIMFKELNGSLPEGVGFNLRLKAVSDDGIVMEMRIQGIKVLEPVVIHEALKISWISILPWHKTGVITAEDKDKWGTFGVGLGLPPGV